VGARPSGGCELAGERRVFEHFAKRAGAGARLFWREQQRVDPVGCDIGHPSDVGGDGRETCGHRLEQRKRRPFGERRQ
jgi:hypothetical protein